MSALITAAIALIAVFTAFSVLTSWVNEQFATFIGLRSKTLIAGVRTLIGDAATTAFFEHPLIASLGERTGEGFARSIGQRIQAPLSAFTANVVGVGYARGSAIRSNSSAPAGAAPISVTPYVSSDAFATVVTDIIRSGGTPAAQSSAAARVGAGWSDLVAGLDALAENPELAPLHRAVAPIWRQAQGDYDTFVKSLAGWYDAHMERVKGWYKRSAQLMLLWIAAFIVILLNVDSLQIWTGFQSNVNLANTVSGVAQAYANANANAAASGKISEPIAPTPPCPAGYVEQSKSCAVDVATLAQVPLGWASAYRGPFRPNESRADFGKDLALKLLGWAITVAALMLGAPFWFDLLNSIVNVRASGPPPPATPSS